VSSVRRRRLAHELRRLREAAGLTCEQVAAQLDCSASKISRMETGKVSATPRDVRDVAALYGVTADLRDSLIQLARESRQKDWWHAYADRVQPQLGIYLDMEGEASEIRIYRVGRIPTLLQTAEYAHATFVPGPASGPQSEDSLSVPLMTERLRRARVSKPKFWAVLDEAALRRQVGGREVMHAQIEHLIALSAAPCTFLQVIPFSSGAYAAMGMPFVIFTFPDRCDPDMVCVPYTTGALWIEDEAEVRTYGEFFNQLQAAALSSADSVALMASMLTDLERQPALVPALSRGE
jgi:transcriptional regulator with XRE-family HTH domain